MESLAKLFGSPARLKILRLFIFNQNTAFTLSNIAQQTKLSKEKARSEASELCSSGFLRKKSRRAPLTYQVNPNFEHLLALNTFIRETVSVRPRTIVKTLQRAGKLQIAILSGFFTGAVESQVDILLVGDHLEKRALAGAVHTLEAELGREIRYASFTTEDFRYRLEVYDRLFRDVFDYPHRLLIDRIGLEK